MAHKLFVFFLVLVGASAAIALALTGYDYYAAPQTVRVFRADHATLKPSGTLGHGLGIVGATLIAVGIAMYSTRKRVRALWNLGKLSTWLEVHMFLCLLGPTLVVYHTTFKAGGIAAISLWTMLSVMASGLVGRFLYVLIPRNAKGAELGTREIDAEFDHQRSLLVSVDLGREVLEFIDSTFATLQRPRDVRGAVRAFAQLQRMKRHVRTMIHAKVGGTSLPRNAAHQIERIARARARLIQKSLLLLQVERLFFYWHAIHLPFTGIMFVTLAVHVGVALWLGYQWIF
jgi:hypothetical protein